MRLQESNDDERARTSCPGYQVGFDFWVEKVVEVNWGLDDWNLPGILLDYYFPMGKRKKKKDKKRCGGIVTYGPLSLP